MSTSEQSCIIRNNMTFLTSAFSLFLILNAFGNIPIFISSLSKFPIQRQRKIILRELSIALSFLLAFNFFGDTILDLLGISHPIIGIAGGSLMLIIALGMIFPRPDKKQGEQDLQEPFIVPLAVPIVAGPGSIASVMIFAEQIQDPWIMTGIILAAWLPSTLILLASANIKNFLGQRGLQACQRLGGMLILLFSVQMFASGLMQLLQEAFHIPHF